MFDAELVEKTKIVEAILEDDLSRDVFRYRLFANLSSDVRFIHALLKKYELMDFDNAFYMWNKIRDHYDIYSKYDVITFLKTREIKKDVVLFGAGHDCPMYISLLDAAAILPVAIIDNYANDNKLCGIKIYRPKDYYGLEEATVIITSRINAKSMYEELRSRGVPKEHIFVPDVNALYIFNQREYFDSDIWTGGENEVYVDAGAYNLSTVKDFAEFAQSCDRVLAFEPDRLNYELCLDKQRETNVKNLEIINKGLWECDTVLHFKRGGDNGTGTAVCEEDDSAISSVPVCSLDSVLNGGRCSFIKMDIEGSELMALKGAKETIKRYNPRLAICLYHKPEDLIDIPLYIHGLVPNYKLKIRHYSTWFYDTVLYAYL